jgi:hypothetical protein
MARAEIARRELANVTIVQADALNTGLEKGVLDLAHGPTCAEDLGRMAFG